MNEKDISNHNFKECIENAEKGFIVSFFVEEATLLSRKTALSENIKLDFDDAPYVLLKMDFKIPIYDAVDLEKKIGLGVWETFFEIFKDSEGIEDFNPRD